MTILYEIILALILFSFSSLGSLQSLLESTLRNYQTFLQNTYFFQNFNSSGFKFNFGMDIQFKQFILNLLLYLL
jgi:hypothetical protein